jgi:DNA-binding transcriptional LysR family regulator
MTQPAVTFQIRPLEDRFVLSDEMEISVGEMAGEVRSILSCWLGFGIVSRVIVKKEIRLGTLCVIPLKQPLIRCLCFIYPEDRFQARLTQTFIDFSRRKLKEPAS